MNYNPGGNQIPLNTNVQFSGVNPGTNTGSNNPYPQFTGVNTGINPNFNPGSNTQFTGVNPGGLPTGQTGLQYGVNTGINNLPLNFKPIAGCKKCGGTGYKNSKKEGKERKICKLCAEASGYCKKCNGTGIKPAKEGKQPKPCKCKKNSHSKK